MPVYSEAFRKIVKDATGRDPQDGSAPSLKASIDGVENELKTSFECVSVFPSAERAGNVHHDSVLTKDAARSRHFAVVERLKTAKRSVR